MTNRPFWLSNGQVLTPSGLLRGAVAIRAGRVIDIARYPGAGTHIDVKGCYISPGFVDLHIWGDPARVSAAEAKTGTTSFLATLGPEPPELLASQCLQLKQVDTPGARCLGIHLEGPFLNPLRAGALASRWLRPSTSRELRQLQRCAGDAWKLLTLAPELPRGAQTIRWCARHGVTVSLGHSDASAAQAQQAVRAGATSVTHVFNGMLPFHHRAPGLLGEALANDRLTTMVILDGVHLHPTAFQVLVRCKGADRIVLTTDSIRHVPQHLGATEREGAFRTQEGRLAGSRLSMIEAVRNAVAFGKIALADAVRMATSTPARLIGEHKRIGTLERGKDADVVVFDREFRVQLTMVKGRIVYRRSR